MRTSLRKLLGFGLLGLMLATPVVFAQGPPTGGKRGAGKKGGKKGGKRGPMRKGGGGTV